MSWFMVIGDSDKCIKTKIKSYGDKVNTNFQDKIMPKENVFSLINLNSVICVNKKFYPQTLLEECKYEIKKNKLEKLISDDLDSGSSDSSDNQFDNESDNQFDN